MPYIGMRPRILTLILFTLAASCAVSSHAQIAGFVTTPSGEPAAGADVFVNHTTCYSSTDAQGRFILQNVPPGFHELVAYKAGFALYRLPMRVSLNQQYNLNVQFSPAEKPAKGKSSSAMVEAFNREMLGTDGSLSYLEGMRVIAEAHDGKYRVTSGPVVVEYPSAGYRIIAFFSPTAYQNISEAAYLYQDLPVLNFSQKLALEKIRQGLYKGSLRHWLRSVIQGAATEEGFQVSDGAAVTTAVDSINALIRIHCPSPLKVTYAGEASTITTTKPIEVNANGLLLNPSVVSVHGGMAKPGLVNQLPLDFRPVKDVEAEFAEAMRYFYEKVYVHTDKPYYYAGEPLWLKAYINYYQRDYSDSLSKVLHVELISSTTEVLAYRRLPIDRGMSYGDLVIPSHLPEGKYYLRAYTNLRLNFGDVGIFTKPIHVLNSKTLVKPDTSYQSPPDAGLEIIPDKDAYKIHDKIAFRIQLDSGLNAANLSVSVTDAAQVIPVREPSILDGYPIVAKEIPWIKELTYRVERGVSFDAQFVNNQGRGEKAMLTFFQFKTGEVLLVETENDGRFWQTGLMQPDSTAYSWKADKARNKPYGSVVIQPRRTPNLEPVAGPKLEFIRPGDQVASDPELGRGSRLLNLVEITDSRISTVPAESAKSRPFGRANYVLTSQQLNVNSGNLLLSLVGKVPGLVVSPTQRVIYFKRSEAASILNTGFPLVTINDQPMGGDPYSTLESIDFNIIESIEFHNRINSMYGTAGAFGVIAVYTKTGASGMGNPDPTLQTIALPGFSPSRIFPSPDYEKSPPKGPDQRSTLYWNPSIQTDPLTGKSAFSFFAADLPGMYRVVVEGVTADGWPLRAETFVVVEDR